MSVNIPESHRDLLEGPVVVTIGTVNPDGQPQLSAVWAGFDGDGQTVLVNTAVGRQKEKNLRQRPQATVLAIDPQNPYRYLEVRGSVELTREGALDHINQMAKLYTGQDSYYGGVTPADLAEQETRILVKIKPNRVVANG
ncbi:MAG: PPOX class F420-dependent oxidoreductase [Chloroflexi bacterium]|nr:PPOX class F420-dependent oxidoreductase [Chloroflexota bacterium]